jgi:hypothetical protein
MGDRALDAPGLDVRGQGDPDDEGQDRPQVGSTANQRLRVLSVSAGRTVGPPIGKT